MLTKVGAIPASIKPRKVRWTMIPAYVLQKMVQSTVKPQQKHRVAAKRVLAPKKKMALLQNLTCSSANGESLDEEADDG